MTVPSTNTVYVLIPLLLAIAAGLLTWFAIDVGTGILARYRTHFTQRTNFQVKELFLFVDPSKLFIINISVMMLGSLLLWALTGNKLLAISICGALALLPRFIYSFMRQHRQQKFEEQLPDALMTLAGVLRAGISLNAAIQQLVLEVANPLAQEFSLLLREQRMGVSLEHSLNNLSKRMPTPTTILVVSAMRIAVETGGSLAETLERTAHTLRSRLQIENKIRALTSQGKLQAWVIGLLPVLLMLVLHQLEPEMMSLLWSSRLGWGTLLILGFLESLGLYVIRKIISIDV